MIERPLPTLLLTAFGPFGGDAHNPSEHALAPAAEAAAAHARVLTEVLPVEYASACARIRHLVRTHRPDVVVSLGLGAGRAAITPERIAINLAEARIPDEAGARPGGLPLIEDAPAAHFSSLPIAAMVAAVADTGVAGAVSYSAGTFVCNAVMFASLDEARRLRVEDPTAPEVAAGFIHVPRAAMGTGDTAGADRAAMPQADIDRGVAAAVCAAVVHRGAPPVAAMGSLTGPDVGRSSEHDLSSDDQRSRDDEQSSNGRMPGIGATE